MSCPSLCSRVKVLEVPGDARATLPEIVIGPWPDVEHRQRLPVVPPYLVVRGDVDRILSHEGVVLRLCG